MYDGDRRVLIIDDDNEVRCSLAACFAAAGYEVESACDGNRGLEAVAARPPDIVILDIVMPRRDGWEVIKRIRENPDTSRAPFRS